MTRPYWAYARRATNKVMPVGMNYLSELVVKPGIRKRLWPLCLYRGNMSPGRAHRLWNMALLMMAAEAETLADGFKLLGNDAYAQLCGPVRAPGKMTMFGFFGRLHDNPDVTENIPGFTEYVKSLDLGRCWLTPVSLESPQQFVAPWRISTHPEFAPKAEKPESGLRNLYYPFLAHDPEKIDDGKALVMLANELVPAWLPDMIRADVCQDLVTGILAGTVEPARADDFVVGYLRRVYRMFPSLQRPEFAGAQKSIDKPIQMPNGDAIPWTERN